jgi:hypothetical protein
MTRGESESLPLRPRRFERWRQELTHARGNQLVKSPERGCREGEGTTRAMTLMGRPPMTHRRRGRAAGEGLMNRSLHTRHRHHPKKTAGQ